MKKPTFINERKNKYTRMTRSEKIIEIISILFILLFVYASISKFADYTTFMVQLKKSPMLAPFSEIIVWAVPITELIICALLFFKSTRLAGLFASFFLMAVFTFYIIAILKFSEFIPCSCGGILQKMSWKQHLFFNVIVCLLAVAAIALTHYHRRRAVTLIITFIALGIGVNASLFQLTYHEKDKYSSFNVTLTSSAVPADSIDLSYNSYYFSGVNKESVYLGNTTAPLHFLTVSTRDHTILSNHIQSDSSDDFIQPVLKIAGDNFYVLDGPRRAILTGDLTSLKATPINMFYEYFNMAEPVNQNVIAFRVTSPGTGNYVLARGSINAPFEIDSSLLKRQADGKFSVDGMLHFNLQIKRLVYLYYYRNQFIVMDSLLHLRYRANTIDSIKVAKINVSTVTGNDHSHTSVVTHEVVVNKLSSSWSSYLFVVSGIRAKNESEEMFSRNTRMDVYSLIHGRYLMSFYIPSTDHTSFRDFRVIHNNVFTLNNHHLFRYDIAHIVSQCDSMSRKKYLPASK